MTAREGAAPGQEATPGEALHRALCESAVAEFDMPIESFESWEHMRESQRNRMEHAAQAAVTAAAAQPAPGREREALEDIARAIQGSTDTGLPLDRDWLVSRAVYGLGQLPADTPEVLSPHYHTNDIQCRDCQLEKALEENAELADEIERLRAEQPAPGDAESLSGHVTVRFPADMINAVKQIAAAEGMTVSAWIRREVEREAGRREQPAPELAAEQLAFALCGLRDAGETVERLAAERDRLRETLGRVLGWFKEEPVVSSRRYASVTRAQLAHAYQDGGLPVGEELRRFL